MKINNHALRQELINHSDKQYQAFHGKLLPKGTPLIGVRMPHLKSIAKDIAKSPDAARSWLISAASDYYEERVLQGLVIASLPTDSDEQLSLICDFLPLINNWAICDSFCAHLKSFRKIQPDGFSFLKKCLKAKHPYTQRFGIVMMLDYFTDQEHVLSALNAYDELKTDEYYVQMAVAWAISIFFIKQRSITLDWLKKCHIDNFTYNKARQKICESFRVSKKDKLLIRSLNR